MKNKLLKVFLSSLAISLLLLVSACGTSEKTTTGSSDKPASGETQHKKLRIVTDATYAPMESLDGDKIVGFDADILDAVMKAAGYDYELVNVGWDPVFVEVQGKTADAGISSITINKKRQMTYDFSLPYFESINKILVPKDSSIQRGADLKGKTVAVQNGTTGQEIAEKVLGKDSQHIKKFESNVLAIMELLKGGANAVVADNAVVEEYAKNNPDKNLKVITDPSFSSEFYGIMLPKGSKLKVDLDKAIKQIIDDGTYTKIYKNTFGTEPNIDALKKQF
ncbi:glutamine ABC transporter substrate-binding protein [Heyndrickxia shackletonii]|uniref:Glutamine ABC transporter substrate-binding protein n=1 Tax=Heyndrickxia shackletonii TaxID=157838 RepID=A0A0Q3WSC8_9BACI|nr:basic amino acid ABC transporter substrate-binding protein [Heyndrickxia shackletonii]KQL50763.1 glutamine ABC transporter substrate-binding protein [Heyndrickxia shackletonii]NEY99718.1 basic amino acid ABC transporter substrate-binding protein [Heyndrickxia shackletonii]